jgi:hypothetical protein
VVNGNVTNASAESMSAKASRLRSPNRRVSAGIESRVTKPAQPNAPTIIPIALALSPSPCA